MTCKGIFLHEFKMQNQTNPYHERPPHDTLFVMTESYQIITTIMCNGSNHGSYFPPGISLQLVHAIQDNFVVAEDKNGYRNFQADSSLPMA